MNFKHIFACLLFFGLFVSNIVFPVNNQETLNVAVIPFYYQGQTISSDSINFAFLLESILVNKGNVSKGKYNYTVISRTPEELERIAKELEFQMSGYVKEESIQKIGRIEGLNAFVIGSVTPSGYENKVILTIKVIRIENAQVLESRTIECYDSIDNIRFYIEWVGFVFCGIEDLFKKEPEKIPIFARILFDPVPPPVNDRLKPLIEEFKREMKNADNARKNFQYIEAIRILLTELDVVDKKDGKSGLIYLDFYNDMEITQLKDIYNTFQKNLKTTVDEFYNYELNKACLLLKEKGPEYHKKIAHGLLPDSPEAESSRYKVLDELARMYNFLQPKLKQLDENKQLLTDEALRSWYAWAFSGKIEDDFKKGGKSEVIVTFGDATVKDAKGIVTIIEKNQFENESLKKEIKEGEELNLSFVGYKEISIKLNDTERKISVEPRKKFNIDFQFPGVFEKPWWCGLEIPNSYFIDNNVLNITIYENFINIFNYDDSYFRFNINSIGLLTYPLLGNLKIEVGFDSISTDEGINIPFLIGLGIAGIIADIVAIQVNKSIGSDPYTSDDDIYYTKDIIFAEGIVLPFTFLSICGLWGGSTYLSYEIEKIDLLDQLGFYPLHHINIDILNILWAVKGCPLTLNYRSRYITNIGFTLNNNNYSINSGPDWLCSLEFFINAHFLDYFIVQPGIGFSYKSFLTNGSLGIVFNKVDFTYTYEFEMSKRNIGEDAVDVFSGPGGDITYNHSIHKNKLNIAFRPKDGLSLFAAGSLNYADYRFYNVDSSNNLTTIFDRVAGWYWNVELGVSLKGTDFFFGMPGKQ